MVSIATVLYVTLHGMPMPLPFLSLAFILFTVSVYLSIFHVSYLSLMLSAQGVRHGANIFDLNGKRDTKGLIFFMVICSVFYLINAILIHFESKFPWWNGLLMALFINYFFISSLMLSTLHKQIISLFNPFAHARIFYALKDEYAILAGVFIFLNIASLSIQHFLAPYLLAFSFFFICLLNTYTLLVCSHLAGYLIFRHSYRLAFRVSIDGNHDGDIWNHKTLDDKVVIRQSNTLQGKQRLDDAARLIEYYTRHSESPILHSNRLYILLRHSPLDFLEQDVARSLYVLLQHEQYIQKLFAILQKILQHLPAFIPDPELGYQLIMVSIREKNHCLASSLLQNFTSRYPNSPRLDMLHHAYDNGPLEWAKIEQ